MINITTSTFNIKDLGAVADGKTLCTDTFKSAVKLCNESGGGTIYVPSGTYLTGPIHLDSNITLFLDAGSVIRFVQDKNEYPLINSRWEGSEHLLYSPLIYGKDLENVSIAGYGVMDGQGSYWWKLMREKTLEYPRPRFISFENSNRVLIEGVKLIDSPAWTINPINCENITINKITIKNPADSPNTDGINPDSCKNVHISNCHVDVGDDCITIKSGTQHSAYRIPCENLTITNCTMVHGHGGVVIGSEMSGSIRNVVISNCVFEGTDRGIRIKSRRGRGGVVEDIRVNNIIMKEVFCPIVLNLYYHCGPDGKDKKVWDKNPYPVSEETPIFRRIHFSNITAREVGAAAVFLYGLPEMPVQDITFNNVSIAMSNNTEPQMPGMLSNFEPMCKQGVYCQFTKNVSFNQVTIENQEGPSYLVVNSENISFVSCSFDNHKEDIPTMVFENVDSAIVQGCKFENANNTLLEINGHNSKNINLIYNITDINNKNIILKNAPENSYTIRK